MIVRRRGTVGELHGLDPFAGAPVAEPRLWWCEPTSAAVVLGSRQQPELLDLDRCARLGLEVVRRRSGGGAVLVVPDDLVWIDVVLPHGVAPDDVRGSMVWIGERWREALAPIVASGGVLEVNDGATRPSPWSDLVCFAGIGPGEVLLDGRKLVGLSQRRTRDGLRIQGLVYRRVPDIDLAELFAGPVPQAALPEIAALGAAPIDVALARLEVAITPRTE
jgi:lipoate-protein ligase A